MAPLRDTVALFVMGEKGYESLSSLIEFSSDIVECVISSEDRSISHDFYQEIKTLCLNLMNAQDSNEVVELLKKK